MAEDERLGRRPPPQRRERHNRSPIAYFAVTGEALARGGGRGAPGVAWRGVGGPASLAVDEDAGVGTNTVPQQRERRSGDARGVIGR